MELASRQTDAAPNPSSWCLLHLSSRPLGQLQTKQALGEAYNPASLLWGFSTLKLDGDGNLSEGWSVCIACGRLSAVPDTIRSLEVCWE